MVRLGLVQSSIGAIVMLATSLLNRVMVVEYALPAALPAGLVAWHYAVQLSRRPGVTARTRAGGARRGSSAELSAMLLTLMEIRDAPRHAVQVSR